MATWLKQSTAVDIPVGPFLDSTDGVTAETALTITQPDVRLKKNNANWAQKNAAQTLSHEENGWYEVSLDATDTNTLGVLLLAIAEAGALPVWREFLVVPAAIYNAFILDSILLPVSVAQWKGVVPADLISTRVDVSVGANQSNVVNAAALATDAVTEIQVGLATAAQVAALNNLSAAQVNAEADTALVDAGVTPAVMARLDVSVGSRLAAAAYTPPDNATITAIDAKTTNLPIDPADQSLIIAATNSLAASIAAMLTTQMTESYAANGVAPTAEQALFAMHQHLMAFDISGIHRTVRKLDGTAAFVETLNSPTAATALTR